jgi:hypothetical protein
MTKATDYKNDWQKEHKISMRFAFDKKTGSRLLALEKGKRTEFVTRAVNKEFDALEAEHIEKTREPP